jgi:hypothetical protein
LERPSELEYAPATTWGDFLSQFLERASRVRDGLDARDDIERGFEKND